MLQPAMQADLAAKSCCVASPSVTLVAPSHRSLIPAKDQRGKAVNIL